ncbi:MAG: kynureninase [Oligoflexales bacterium]
MNFESGKAFAQKLDEQDPLKDYRQKFYIPKQQNGDDEYYFCGNSLGLQPKNCLKFLELELEKWQQLGVKGHTHGEYPWMPYHEFLLEDLAMLVGARPEEVVPMNSLTVNLHLMLVSFYRPTSHRYKILIEDHAFPSDQYALASQIKYHGFAEDALIRLKPKSRSTLLTKEDWLEAIEREGEQIALVLLPGVQYYSGQISPMKEVTLLAQQRGCKVGIDLAHAVGNIPLSLHDWQVDFAVWCHYKYLNSGPGAVGGCFIHKKHHNSNLTKFAGWWGHDKNSRFKMRSEFKPSASAEAWQLSNPPILAMAAIRASMQVFREVGGMEPLRQKSLKMTAYLEFLLQSKLANKLNIVSPTDPEKRGCQLSLELCTNPGASKQVYGYLSEMGVTSDWREPNVMRVAPVPLYNCFMDVYKFVELLEESMSHV